MSIFSTSGQKPVTPISKEDVLELIAVYKFDALQRFDTVTIKLMNEIAMKIADMPAMLTADGKKLRRAYYPRVMVKADWDDEPHQIGDNAHDSLTVAHIDGGTYLAYENMQLGCSTAWSEDGYKFVGEKEFLDFGDETEHIRFDAVWVEDE